MIMSQSIVIKALSYLALGVLLISSTHSQASAVIEVTYPESIEYQAAPVEQLDKRTRNSKSYYMGEGRYSVDVSSGSIHYRVGGEWWDIDTSFETSISPWDWQVTKNSYGVRVKEDITSGQVIEFNKAGEYVTLQPMALEWTNDLNQIEQISMPANNGVVVSDNNSPGRITWRNTYGAGIDLAWNVGSDRLTKALTISGFNDLPPPQQYIIDGGNPVLRYNFIFQPSPGIDVYIDGDLWDKRSFQQTYDYIEFRKGPQILWGFTPLLYYDSGDKTEQSITTIEKRGSSLYIYLTVPFEWLQTAVYPVYIDPTIDGQIGASLDDVLVNWTNTDPWRFRPTHITSGVGRSSSTAKRYGTGLLFRAVNIPQGATVTTANISIYGHVSQSGQVAHSQILAHDTDNATVITDLADYQARRGTDVDGANDDNITDAIVDWNNMGAFTVNQWHDSPGIKTVIQEIVDRVGWVTGNSLLIFWDDHADRSTNDQAQRQGKSWDGDNSKGVKLHIEYVTIAAPTVVTNPASSISFTDATLSGNITSGNATERGFEWGTISGNLSDNFTELGDFSSANGTFTHGISGLSDNTTYFFLAKALNVAGTGKGTELNFTTDAYLPPTVVTGNATDIEETTVTLGGSVSDNGSGNLTLRGFEWGTTPGIFTDNSTESGLFANGAYTLDITGLSPDTIYFWRAIADNDVPTAIGVGEQSTFRTEDQFKTIEVGGFIQETTIRGSGKPTEITLGVHKAFSLPVWNGAGNVDEELYFQIYVPHQWNGDTDITIHFDLAISANESLKNFNLELDHSHFSSGEDVVNASSVNWTIETATGVAEQYQSYEVKFTVPFDHMAGDPIAFEDVFHYRLRRIAATANETGGEILVFHSGGHFQRGDLDNFLTAADLPEVIDTSDFLTGASMEDLTAEFSFFVRAAIVLVLLIIAIWRKEFYLYVIGALVGLVSGWIWRDSYTTPDGVTISLVIVGLGLYCLIMAGYNVFRKKFIGQLKDGN